MEQIIGEVRNRLRKSCQFARLGMDTEFSREVIVRRQVKIRINS